MISMRVVSLSLFTFLLIVTVIYLVAIAILIENIRRDHAECWASIGSPTKWDPTGMTSSFLKVVCGIGLPVSVASTCKKQLITARILLVLSIVIFVVLVVALNVS